MDIQYIEHEEKLIDVNLTIEEAQRRGVVVLIGKI